MAFLTPQGWAHFHFTLTRTSLRWLLLPPSHFPGEETQACRTWVGCLSHVTSRDRADIPRPGPETSMQVPFKGSVCALSQSWFAAGKGTEGMANVLQLPLPHAHFPHWVRNYFFNFYFPPPTQNQGESLGAQPAWPQRALEAQWGAPPPWPQQDWLPCLQPKQGSTARWGLDGAFAALLSEKGSGKRVLTVTTTEWNGHWGSKGRGRGTGRRLQLGRRENIYLAPGYEISYSRLHIRPVGEGDTVSNVHQDNLCK